MTFSSTKKALVQTFSGAKHGQDRRKTGSKSHDAKEPSAAIHFHEYKKAIPGIPGEMLQAIFTYLKCCTLSNVTLTCRQFYLIAKPMLPAAFLTQYAIGKSHWERFFGDVGEVPPLPENIFTILDSPCPFWPGKKVLETHMLVLIPKMVNGEPLTLNSLGKMILKPKRGLRSAGYSRFWARERHGEKPVTESHWVLMTRHIIPNSRGKSEDDPGRLISKAGEGRYRLPKTLEAATAILMYYFAKGKRLYISHGDFEDRMTSTFCEDQSDDGDHESVGNFDAFGIAIEMGSISARYCGVGGVRILLYDE